MNKTKEKKYQSISINIASRANKYLLVLLVSVISLVIFFGLVQGAEAACTGSSPTWNSTPDYASVNSCLSQASSGDTINVSAGSATWSSTLTITKGVKLIGAGIEITVISGNNHGEGNFLISYSPASNSQVFRVSGFTFNITNQQGIRLQTNSEPTTQTNIRIDNNRFTNSDVSRSAIMNWGCFGVIDSNTFDNLRYPLGVGQSGTNSGQKAWEVYPDLVWGADNDSIYVEDNTFSNISLGVITDGDQGGRYVVRYNNIIPGTGSSPLFDIHGGRGNLWGTMGAEIYGNNVNGSGYLFSHRGGRGTAHHNNLSGGGDVNIYNNTGCPPDPYSLRQRINNSYHFLNRRGVSGSLLGWVSAGGDKCGDVVENSTFWMDNSSCEAPNTCSNITVGTGCGTLANRPASCTTGTGYWATNQSCTNLTDMVGVNPSTPISGTLYKCTSTNTWRAYYTPYTYPHPLRNEESSDDTIKPSAITNLSTSNPTSNSITLSWTSPGDDGNTGTASSYDIRYSTSNITESNWSLATPVSDEPTPLIAGSSQSMTVSGLAPNTTYYFAIKTRDEVPANWSDISNVPSATTSEAPSGRIEAESGAIASPMQIVSDDQASGGKYIQTIEEYSGTATYTFNINTSGTYKIIARDYALDNGSNSFYVTIDSGSEFAWHLNSTNDPDKFNVWREEEINQDGLPFTIQLNQGVHTLTFRGREMEAKIDYFRFVQVTNDTIPPSPPTGLIVN